jgi:protein phosphatase
MIWGIEQYSVPTGVDMTRISWRTAGLTDCGLVRTENQDNFFISPDQRLFVVADGMGGEQGGATASRIAVETMSAAWASGAPTSQFSAWLTETIKKANKKVAEAAVESKSAKSMGTTVVAGIQSDEGVIYIAHVGDSRAYLVRNKEAKLITNDHSVVWEMYQKGQLSQDQCRTSPWRHLITRCLGHEQDVEVDCTSLELEIGDWVIMATDGLSTVIDDARLAELIGDSSEPEPLCKELVAKTLDAGAPDNVTIIATNYIPVSVETQSKVAAATNGV